MAEVLGNLLDNARKWAQSQVRVGAAIETNALIIEVTDDGPGIPEAEHGNVLARGRRLDETVSGSGFGLAIAAEYIEQHGARLELLKADDGGLRARITLPQARFHVSG